MMTLRSIKGYGSFDDIFKIGKKIRIDDAFAVVVYNHNSGGFANVEKHTIFYGVTIGKRIAKKAVIRNRIKRLIREGLRIAVKEMEEKELFVILYIIYHKIINNYE
jgi:ribonuclease P protein component